MKPSAKPISSPGRTEKFPPPLMRFLRSNVGSKSRGRSRASPMMFMRRKNNATAIETQEPSSPKVTCIGQVRVRRSSTRRRKRSGTRTRRRCRWIRAARCCPCFRKKFKPNSSPIFQRLVSFFQCGFRRKPKVRTNSPPREPPFRGGVEISNKEIQVVAAVDDDDAEEEEETAEALISSNSSPPKNALLLTRCRSAPYRSTSLASRFWGSPLKNEENQEETEEEEKEKEQSTKPNNGGKTVEIEKPTSQRASVSDQDPSGGLEFEENEEFAKNIDEHSVPERIVKSANIKQEKTGEEEEEVLGSSSRPLILTRCKSEPSRTAEKMNPEVGLFWKKRRLGIPDSCLPNNS
uniref:Protamine P1 family protein n=1 Tax=Cucumis sativus TaxID=3659 RepID=A0A0A0LDY5_CUCSA